MTLKNFPRGGKKVQEKKPSTSIRKKYEKVKKRKQERGSVRKNDGEEENFVANTAERLSYTTICEGLVVLGRIFEITEYDLLISIPGGLIGRAQVTDISESYTNLLQSLIKCKDDQPSEFKPLSELYSCGDQVVCYIKSIQPQEKWQIMLSLEPKLINQNLNIDYLSNGMKVICTVSSIEDHGCIVDIGLTNVRGFVPLKDYTAQQSLSPGKQLLCHIKEIKTSENTSTIKLSAKLGLVEAISNIEIKSLDSLMPGTNFNLHVKKTLSNGLCVSFGNNHVGYINQLYLKEPLSKYSKGMKITGKLLYILPTVKFGYFSLLANKPKDNSIKPGDIIEEATVLFRESAGIVLQLTKTGVRGFLPLKRTNFRYDKILEKFAPGSIHKCRVISYCWMDGTYVCSMQHSLMQERYFSLLEFKPGDLVNVKITNINMENGFIDVQAGKIVGHITSDHISDAGISALKEFKVGQEVEGKVLAISNTRKKVYLTLKKSLLSSDLPILYDIEMANKGSIHHGTIIKINKGGIMVKFFGELRGWIPYFALDKQASAENWNYSIGQTIMVQIESVDKNSGRIDLSIPTKRTIIKEEKFEIGEHVEGTITESSIEGVYLRISKNDGQTVSTGFLPAGHMSPCMKIAALLASKCIPGDTLSALVFATEPSLILTRTFLLEENCRQFDQLKVGNSIPCSIRDIEPDGIRVILPIKGCSPFGYVSYSNVSHFNMLHRHQILFAKITSINRKDKLLGLSLTLKKIFDELTDPTSRMMVSIDALHLYFNKLAELAKNPYYENRPISSVALGQKVVGKVAQITDAGIVVQLENNLLGAIRKDHCAGSPKVGDTVSATILWKDYILETVEMTMLPSLMKAINIKQNKQVHIPDGKVVRGKILMVTNWFTLIILKGHGKGLLAAVPVRRHTNDIQPDVSPYFVHAKIRCYVILHSSQSDIMPICMMKSAFESKYIAETKPVKDTLKRKKVQQTNDEPSVKKIKTEEPQETVEVPSKKKNSKKHISEDINEETSNKKKIKQKKEKGSKKIEEENDLTETRIIVERSSDGDKREKPRIPECGFFWDEKPDLNLLKNEESSSDSEVETEQQPKQKKKKLSAAERREQEKQKEREIRQREEALASNTLPNSVDQFDRLVLASPDSSIIWLQYMAYHLQTTEIEKARAVARRAVKTISFREENERLNVWNAWLNLESKFGTPESLNDVFQEAVRTNDSLKVYTHMLTVHFEAERQNELEKIINTMLGKFKQNPDVWINCGTVLLKMGLKDKSRHIMQRALQSLPPSQHVNLMAKFALLENKFGDKPRSQTLFEQILSSYPKRVDIWSCYIDSLIKSEDIDIARKVLERAVVQTLPPRKMKTLFKKFISFEEQYGTRQNIDRVQQMAAEYVEKQCNKN
ncbi:ribosomal RNA Processing 5 [Nomia melanderi]|uniref:ribosomal RNA Processing 5 n=1 Tax=Nomia melanderi TaxID=2448451 RepID=UPI003FCD0B69